MRTLAQTAFSMLDLVPVRMGGTVAQALHNSLDLAQHVERLGFTRYWLAEHHNMDGIASSATAVLIGHVAGGTSRIRVGSGGIMLPNHAPLVVAEAFGTLATLYPDRIDLGLGRAPGTDPHTMRALRRDRPETADDFPRQVLELQALLAPPVPGQRLIAMPGAGTEVPIWLLGSSLFSAQLAGQMGLPYAFASHFAPRFLMDAIRMYREQFRPSAVLSKLRGERLAQRPPVASMDGLWSEQERAGVEAFLGVAVVGGPDTVRQGLQRLLDATQVDEFIFVSDLYDHNHRLRSLEIVQGMK